MKALTLPTLPGDLPGLLRWCSPVRDAEDPHRLGVVVGTHIGGVVRAHWTWGDATEDVDRSRLLLDLTDATGRAHAAWWLAERCRPVVDWLWVHNASGLWTQTGWDEEDREVFWEVLEQLVAIHGLRPSDPRTLPDGSRCVDAEALRIVALHVAGRQA